MVLQKLFPAQEMLSVEIGGEHLKLAHLRKSATGFEVLNLVSKDIRTIPDDEMVGFIQNYLAEHKITTKKAITFVSPRYTINKTIELPSTNPTEINEIIKLQASRHTPYAREEIVLDHIPIGVFKGGYTKVFLVIVHRDVIKRAQDILERAGLELKKVILGEEIISQWLEEIKGQPPEPLGVLHFEYGNVDFLVIQNGKIIFARSIPIGGIQLVNEPAVFQDKFLQEVQSSLETYQIENLAKVKQIVLAGLTDNLKETGRLLEQRLGLITEVQPYLERISFARSAELARTEATKETSFLSVLAAPRYYQGKVIDLTPEGIKVREAVAEKSRDVMVTGTLLMFVLILISVLFAKEISSRQSLLNSLKKDIDKDHGRAGELKKNYKMTKEVRKYLTTRGQTLGIILEIHKVIPKYVWLGSVNFSGGNEGIKITGSAETIEQAGDDGKTRIITASEHFNNFTAELERSPLFKKPVVKSFGDRDGTGKIFDFELTVPLEEGENK